MTREITTPEEMQCFLQDLQNNPVLTKTQQQFLKMQESLIGIATINSPTLIDSSVSGLFEQLWRTLESAVNGEEKVKAQRCCADTIVNMTNLLDANFCARLENDNSIAIDVLRKAGEGMNKNIRDILLMANASVSAVAKTATSAADVLVADTMTVATSLGSQAINTPITATISPDGSIIIEKGSAPADISQIQADLNREAMKQVNNNMGRMTEDVERYANEWHEKVDKIIIHNMFSDERMAERSDLLSKIYDWYKKPAKDSESKEFFYSCIEKIIEKLEKYQLLIGKSIQISDLIERYLKDMIEFRHKGEKILGKFNMSDLLLLVLLPGGGMLMGGGFLVKKKVENTLLGKKALALVKKDEKTATYERFKAVAKTYNPIA